MRTSPAIDGNPTSHRSDSWGSKWLLAALGIGFFFVVAMVSLIPSQHHPPHMELPVPDPGRKVSQERATLSIYYESKCPDSINFVIGPLADLLQTPGVLDYVNVELVPFGKSNRQPDGTYTCQHGEPECQGNRVLACAQHVLVEKVHATEDAFLKFNYCYMAAIRAKRSLPSTDECLDDEHKNLQKAVDTCAAPSDPSGIYAKQEGKTRAAAPQGANYPSYVPWVTLNGKKFGDNGPLLPRLCKKLEPAPAALCQTL